MFIGIIFSETFFEDFYFLNKVNEEKKKQKKTLSIWCGVQIKKWMKMILKIVLPKFKIFSTIFVAFQEWQTKYCSSLVPRYFNTGPQNQTSLKIFLTLKQFFHFVQCKQYLQQYLMWMKGFVNKTEPAFKLTVKCFSLYTNKV